jgi:hypothetical protein
VPVFHGIQAGIQTGRPGEGLENSTPSHAVADRTTGGLKRQMLPEPDTSRASNESTHRTVPQIHSGPDLAGTFPGPQMSKPQRS